MVFGDLILASQIFDDSRGIVSNSCQGKLTANIFFGKAGVGKSTLAGLISTAPGIFEVGTVTLLINKCSFRIIPFKKSTNYLII